MKFTKRHLCDLPSCYAAASVRSGGETLLLLAPDAPGPCYAFDSVTFRRETVWEEPGGTMAIVALPGGNGGFLAVQRFLPGFHAENAELVYVNHEDGKWRVNTLLKLPFLHRFAILERAGVRYLLCATLCTTKKNEQDWTSPGGLYAAELPDKLPHPISLARIAGGMTRNHGFWQVNQGTALISCDQGIFEILPPEKRGAGWTVKQLTDKPASDIALGDIDGDGADEMAAIEPFHGNRFVIYKNNDYKHQPLFSYPGRADFLHVVWGGKLRGENVFIGGGRGGDKELFLIRHNHGNLTSKAIDKGAGPANICVVNGKERDLILAANHEKGEGAVYVVED
jgi:hypothetical protein